jgi:REP element-mobilizing transposase RayT
VPTARAVTAQYEMLGFRLGPLFLGVPTARSIFQFIIFRNYATVLNKSLSPLSTEIRISVQAYFVEVGENSGSFIEEIYMAPDHLHWLCSLPKTISIADLVMNVKIPSSTKIKEMVFLSFSWQKGYGAFSVSPSKLETVRKYIQNQPEHQTKFNFQTEYSRFLTGHQIEFDEQYFLD